MKTCNKCNIQIETSYEHCPLCHQTLDGTVDDNHVELYPLHDINPYITRKTQRILFFFTFFFVIVLGVINILFYESGFWSLIPIGALIYLWLLIRYVILNKSTSIMRVVLSTFFVSLLLFFINTQTDPDFYWSLDYVLPALIIANNTTIFLILMIKKEGIKHHSFSLVLLVLVSLIPLLLNYVGIVVNPLVPLVAFAHGLLILLHLLVFYPKVLKELIKRFFHI